MTNDEAKSMIRRITRTILGLAVIVGAGCDTQDTARLAKVGKLTLCKVQSLADDQAKMFPGLHPWQSEGNEHGLAARVEARLQWEKSLADAKIGVTVKDGKVELKGKVADLTQRRRAVELAESTVGVDLVVDLLEVPVP